MASKELAMADDSDGEMNVEAFTVDYGQHHWQKNRFSRTLVRLKLSPFKDCDPHAETITVQNYDALDCGKGCSEVDSEQILGKVLATEEKACFFYN
ncbi:hypothetical protein RJ639_003793 [Escallonia herrerae]|uniref:Uncharacterized protein n=1 Tax=Escallonia herrerae TaxID=1293975 RepID=A0AA89B1T1_9ASTE|nr:hypothetical protein RJ639_003793 [Escallonia herrerae]